MSMNKHQSMTIVAGGGLNFEAAVEDALMDGWKAQGTEGNHQYITGIDDDGIIGHLPDNAKYVEFTK